MKHQNHIYINISKNTTYVALVIRNFVAQQCNTRTLHVISQNGKCARKIGLADVDTSMHIERHVCSNIFNTWWNFASISSRFMNGKVKKNR